jgi:hypothetical protein
MADITQNGNGNGKKKPNWMRLAEAAIVMIPIIFFFVDIVNRQAAIEKNFEVFRAETKVENAFIIKELGVLSERMEKHIEVRQ